MGRLRAFFNRLGALLEASWAIVGAIPKAHGAVDLSEARTCENADPLENPNEIILAKDPTTRRGEHHKAGGTTEGELPVRLMGARNV